LGGLVKNDKKTIFGWAMYDWANSAFATVMLTAIFPVFFEGTIVPEDGWNGISGEALWGFLTGGAAIILFAFMPILGSIADFSASKKRFLRVFAYGGALFTASLFLMQPGMVVPAMILFVFAQFGFVGANVFYDGFLPDLTTEDTIDKVSSKGFALGYVGGGLYLGISLGLVLSAEALGIETLLATQLAILGTGIWWAAFSFYAFKRIPETGSSEELPGGVPNTPLTMSKIGMSRAWATGKKIAKTRHLLLFLVSFILYNDAVSTTISQSGAYASGTLELELETIIGTILIVQFVAFIGALLFGWIAGRVSTKGALQVSLVVWIVAAALAYRMPAGDAAKFLALGALIGLVLGGVQALSRSLYGSMIPEDASAEMYGFYSVISKFSAIFGPIIFAYFTQTRGSGRAGIASLVVFFTLGLVLFSFVDVEKARAEKDIFLEH
jgi:UMF1 family MFS transporter